MNLFYAICITLAVLGLISFVFRWGLRREAKKTFSTLTLLLLCTCANGATIVALSPSPTDMGNAVTASANGDTITIHTGVGTYGSPLYMANKSVILQPYGDGPVVLLSTMATGGGDPSTMSILLAAGATRITGCVFSNSALNGGCAILASAGVRIDHCFFYNFKFGNYFAASYACVDHNAYTNCTVCVRVNGASATGLTEWNTLYPIAFNDINHFVTVELCTFGWKAPYWNAGAGAVCVSSGQGSSYLFRYNDAYNSVDDFTPAFDWHGDNNDGTYGNLNSMVYSNRFTIGGTGSIDKFVDARGGNGLVYSNQVFGATGSGVAVREEWPLQFTSFIDPHMQVTNMWVWENYQQGVLMPTFVDDSTGLINLDTQYFTHAPSPIPQPTFPAPLDIIAGTNFSVHVAGNVRIHGKSNN